eukprot:358672-Chlamydomonas_euryale.AAC.5
MVIGRPMTLPTFKLSGKQLLVTESFKYVGSFFADDGSTSRVIDVRNVRAMIAFRQFQDIWASPKLNNKQKMYVYCTFVLPIFLHGCETWTWTELCNPGRKVPVVSPLFETFSSLVPGHTKLIPWPEIRAAAAERALDRQAWRDAIKTLLRWKAGRMTQSCAHGGKSGECCAALISASISGGVAALRRHRFRAASRPPDGTVAAKRALTVQPMSTHFPSLAKGNRMQLDQLLRTTGSAAGSAVAQENRSGSVAAQEDGISGWISGCSGGWEKAHWHALVPVHTSGHTHLSYVWRRTAVRVADGDELQRHKVRRVDAADVHLRHLRMQRSSSSSKAAWK